MKKLKCALIALCGVVGGLTTFSGCSINMGSITRMMCKHQWGEWTASTAATCTTQGTQQRKCLKCDETQTDNLSVSDHAYDVDNIVWTWDGYTSAKATVYCKFDNTHVKEFVANVGEKLVSFQSCTEDGVKEYTASISIDGTTYTNVKTEKNAKLGHTVETVEGTAPTCLAGGVSDGEKCTTCGDTLKEQTALDKVECDYVGVVTAPVCGVKDGYTTYTCSMCQDVYVADYVHVDTHTWGDWVEEDGNTVRYCSNGCGDSQRILSLNASYRGGVLLTGAAVARENISVTAALSNGSAIQITDFTLDNTIMTTEGGNPVRVTYHTFSLDVNVPAIYDNLSATTLTEEFQYTASNGVITINKYVGNSENIVVPAHIEGVPVRTIAASAFKNNKTIKTVTIPDSVKTIGNEAFLGCTLLTDVVLGANVQTLGTNAFGGCSVLENVDMGGVQTVGDYAFNACVALKEITLGENVTSLGQYAFNGCSALASVNMASSKLEVINYAAFNNCTSLASINIPSTVHTINGLVFAGCTALTSVTLNEGLKTIAYGAFGGCPITSIIIPNSVTSMASGSDAVGAFENCKQLKTVVIGDGLTQIDAQTFYGCYALESVVIGNGVETIGSNAFGSCVMLTNVTMGKNVKTIGEYAFYQCLALEKIVMGESVQTIGTYAFYACVSLTNVDMIGSSVQTIGNYAFYGCTSLASINIPASVQTIGAYAFQGCSMLTNVTLNEGLKTICYGAFASCPITSIIIPNSVTEITISGTEGAFNHCKQLKSVVIGGGLTIIGQYTFYMCTALKSVVIGDGVTEIGAYAFNSCYNLKDVTMGKGVQTIGEGAFIYCRTLESITLGENVQTIGYLTFQYCSALKNVDMSNANVQTIGSYAFSNCTSLVSIDIPASVQTIYAYVFQGCSSLANVTLNEGLKTIGHAAFSETVITEIVIPNSVTFIDSNGGSAEGAFEGCKQLKKVVIGDGLTIIRQQTFYNCSALETVVIGANVTTIEAYAFANCTALAEITLPANVQTVASNAFSGHTVVNRAEAE